MSTSNSSFASSFNAACGLVASTGSCIVAEPIDEARGGARIVVDDEDAALLLRQRLQERGVLAHAHLPPGEGAHQHLVGQGLEAREVLHARDERDLVDRLGQEVVGAALQAAHLVGDLIESGDEHDGNVMRFRVRLEPPAVSKPSMPGIITSRRTTSTRSRSQMSMASWPLLAVSTSKYSAESRASRSFTFARISSTTSTRAVIFANTLVTVYARGSPTKRCTVSRKLPTEMGLEM